jgi:hypothetical protein
MDGRSHQKAVQQFVLFKQSPTDIVKDKARDKGAEQPQTGLHVIRLFALLDAVTARDMDP